MSIDARIASVTRHPDGSGSLHLIDRPSTIPGRPAGIAGQPTLSFAASPAEVEGLAGMDVWGPAGCLMLGSVEIARREGYTRIAFHGDGDGEVIRRAVAQKGGMAV